MITPDLNIWKSFVLEGNEVPEESTRSEILDSWYRSRSFRIDPYKPGIVKVSEEELSQRKKENALLLQAASPYLHKLYNIIKGSISLISLTDNVGLILEILADDEVKRISNFPSPGSVHLESTIGTCGIGTALANERSVEIRGFEHWLYDNHDWCCHSSPIRLKGKICGCFNLSYRDSYQDFFSQGMVVATVNAIEREMELREALREKQNLFLQQELILEQLDAGIILLDRNSRIIRMNSAMKNIFELEGSQEGLFILDIAEQSKELLKLLDLNEEIHDQECPVRIKGKVKYYSVTSAFVMENNRKSSQIVTLRDSKQIHQIVNKVSGAKAWYNFKHISGISSALQKPLKIARLAASNAANVLILGESGTGKELIAQAIHNGGERRDHPFVAINCGALSPELIQSELFGYVEGSFTGALKGGNPGKFELANGGTLFLDEIGELPLDAQANLLRVLQTGEVNRIGGHEAVPVNVRIIAATNRNLEQEVRAKTFRHDIFYRLNVLLIELPPLRDRREDITLLCSDLLKKICSRMQKDLLKLESQTLNILQNYNWPGNIRELENILERAVTLADDTWIKPENLPEKLFRTESESNETKFQCGHSLKSIETDYMISILKETGGNLRETARRMSIARSTVYNKLKKMGLSATDFR